MKSEILLSNFAFSHNSFSIEGTSGIKYTYNNGTLATDPDLASQNFLKALQRIPALIDKQKEKLAQMQTSIIGKKKQLII